MFEQLLDSKMATVAAVACPSLATNLMQSSQTIHFDEMLQIPFGDLKAAAKVKRCG